jgi:hypothetical protein
MSNPVNEIVRGEEARALLENPLIADAFKAVKDGIMSGMNQSAMTDNEMHTRLVIALQLINQIERQITEHVTTGKMAELQLKEETAADKVRKFIRR